MGVLRSRNLAILLCFFVDGSVAKSAWGQLSDSMDAYPPRWNLIASDCEAIVTDHEHESDPAASGGMCESITVRMSRGTEALLAYPIEPVRIIDELSASVAVKALKAGVAVGFRVRYPHLIDPATRRPMQSFLFGAVTRHAGEFQRVGVGSISDSMRMATISMRNRFGAEADVSSPYVDAVVINVYTGPGTYKTQIDDLRVESMVPLSDRMETDRVSLPAAGRSRSVGRIPADEPVVSRRAFPPGVVTRILQHQGEPLAWVRSLGFDAIFTSTFPTAELLGEAVRARVRIYCPPPSAPMSSVESMLEPVAGWVVGAGLPMDSSHQDEMDLQIRRLRALPSRWQRPVLGSPVEAFRHYGGLLDGVVLDSPPRCRGLSSQDLRRVRQDQMRRCANVPTVIAVDGGPNPLAVMQTDAIASRIGSPMSESYRWHAMWRGAADAIAESPSAILFRSSRSLTSGTLLDQNRAMAMSYVNRQIAGVSEWIADAIVDPSPMDLDAPYAGHRLIHDNVTLLILTSSMIRGDEVLSGDGQTLAIDLPSSDQGKTIWRLTHFSAERMSPSLRDRGTQIELVSPDVVEILAISDDIRVGGRLAQSVRRFAEQAATDRLQLVNDAWSRSQSVWRSASALRAVDTAPPTDLLNVARMSLDEAESLIRTRQFEASLRLTRRADAWCLKSDWGLADALLRGPRRLISSPPMMTGNLETQLAWQPLLTTNEDALRSNAMRSSWGPNRLNGGDLDQGDRLQRDGWTFGRRNSSVANIEATWTDRGVYAGTGALAVRVTSRRDDPLPGGYEGTHLMVATPSVHVQRGDAVRVDAVVRTLGFGNPHEGLLIYDSIGTQSMGVLVRDRSEWTPVSLLRHAAEDQPVQVMFEVLGSGEAVIDEIQVRVWSREPDPSAAYRRLSSDVR
ncbi:MAG: hypothetical protein AAF670_02465 [Planctomycetota bacterium]